MSLLIHGFENNSLNPPSQSHINLLTVSLINLSHIGRVCERAGNGCAKLSWRMDSGQDHISGPDLHHPLLIATLGDLLQPLPHHLLPQRSPLGIDLLTGSLDLGLLLHYHLDQHLLIVLVPTLPNPNPNLGVLPVPQELLVFDVLPQTILPLQIWLKKKGLTTHFLLLLFFLRFSLMLPRSKLLRQQTMLL